MSIAQFGCLLGWVVTLIPSLTCGLGAWWVVVTVRTWLAGWERLDLSLLGFEYTVDLIDLVHLKGLLATLQTVEGRALPLLVALVVAVGILGGGLIAFILAVLGGGYNLAAWLTGGVVVELQALPDHRPARRP